MMSPLSVGANAGTQESDQCMKIPNFASWYHPGTGCLSTDSLVG